MKTLCAVVVVLSLTAPSQPASLACKNLLKPADKGPDVSGRWYFIAFSTENCFITTLMRSLLIISAQADFTPKDTPDHFNAHYNIKMYDRCGNESEQFFYKNKNFYDLSDNVPTGKPAVLLQSGCPDCMVIKEDAMIDNLILLSRRKTITEAELNEFKAQTECLGWISPLIFTSDHDYQNCKSLDSYDHDTDVPALSSFIVQRLENFGTELLKCIRDHILYYPKLALNWFEELGNDNKD